MNTKGIKFLAVLAVMALAFAAFVAMAPSEDADVAVYNNNDFKYDPKVIEDNSKTKFFITEDTTVKVKVLTANLEFYVQNGKILELDIKAQGGELDTSKTITIKTVTGNQEYVTSGMIGKVVDDTTQFQFKGVSGMSVYYKAATPTYTVSYDEETKQFTTRYDLSDSSKYAQVSADKAFAEKPELSGTNATVVVATGQTIVVQKTSGPLTEIAGLGYGVLYKSISSTTSGGTTTTTYTDTYYATKNNAGDLALTTGEQVLIKNGSAAITTSGAAIKVSSAALPRGTTTAITIQGGSTNGSLSATGSLGSGSMTFSGNVTPGMTVKNGATVTIANKATIVGTPTMTLDGTLVVKTGEITQSNGGIQNLTVQSGSTSSTPNNTGVIVLENGKLWQANPSNGVMVTTSSFYGLMESSAISKNAKVKDEISTSVIAQNQTFELVQNTTVFQSLTVNGILIIDEGVTLTVENGASVTMAGQYAQIINNGKIVVKAGKEAGNTDGLFVNGGVFVNNGTIDFSAKAMENRSNATFSITAGVASTTDATTVNAIKFTNNGTVTISKNDKIVLDAFYNYGTMNISGQLGTTTIKNYGRIVYNGAELTGNVTNQNMNNDATVFVSSYKTSAGKSFIVNNTSVSKSGFYAGGNAIITISGSNPTSTNETSETTATLDGYTVRGVTFTGAKSDYAWTNAIDLQGAMGLAIDNGSAGTITFQVQGATTVNKTFSIPKDMTLAFATTGEGTSMVYPTLDVTGTMTINKDAYGSGSANLYMSVTGKVIDNKGALNSCTNYVAAKYETTNAVIYTTLEDALVEAAEANIMTIDVGAITITKDTTIPEGMSINGIGSNSMIKIGSSTASPTIYIESTGRLSVDNIWLEHGVIFAEDSADISDDAVKAHVKTEDGDSVLYESLDVALATATSGELIELNRPFVLVNGAITIPAGVVVDATADSKEVVMIGSSAAIDGTLIIDNFYYVAETSDDIGITVNGYMKDGSSAMNLIKNHWFTPVGVSYTESTLSPRGDEVTYYVITSLDHLQDAVDAADDKKVTVEGKAKLGDVTIKGTEDMPAEVTFNEDVNAGTITLENATIIAKSGKQIDATFADEYGAIIIDGAYVGGVDKTVNIYSLGEQGVYISGPLTDDTNGTYSILFMGKTGMNNAVIGWGNATNPVLYPTVTFAGDTLVTGNKNQIMYTAAAVANPTNKNAGIVTISGALTADNGSKVLIISDVEVLGTLAAKEKTSSSTNGTVEVEGNIFLGTTKDAVFSEKALLAHYNNPAIAHAYYGEGYPVAQAAAALSGKIEVLDGKFITAVPGSSIDEPIIDDMDSMDIMIEGQVWLTVYGTTSYKMDGLTPDIKDCSVTKIYDADNNAVASYDSVNRVIYGSIALNLGLYDAINMDLDYNIYTILIKTDASIKAVYIDGILTYTGNEENQFYLPRVAAGTHTVTVEPTTGYTAENAYLYTEMGTLLKGLKFTFDESDCVWVIDAYDADGDVIAGHYQAIYNVAGTEKITEVIPEPEQVSEWTITTILLLVLVVLIAIMAVIVALRLNRS